MPFQKSTLALNKKQSILNALSDSLNLIACSKCLKPIGKERVYFNGGRLCLQCGSQFSDNAEKKVVTSPAWASLSELVQKLSVLHNDKATAEKNLPTRKKITGRRLKNSGHIKRKKSDQNVNCAASKDVQESSSVNRDAMTFGRNVKECVSELNLITPDSNVRAFLDGNVADVNNSSQVTPSAPSGHLKRKKEKENSISLPDSMDFDVNVTPTPIQKSLTEPENTLPSNNFSSELPTFSCNSALAQKVSHMPYVSPEPSCGLMNTSNTDETCFKKPDDIHTTSNSNESPAETFPENEASMNVLKTTDENNRYNLLESVLKDGIEHFFKNGLGVTILKEYTDDSPKIIDQSFPSDTIKQNVNNVIQSELQYFFQCEDGNKLLKMVITEAIHSIINSKISSGGKDQDSGIENETDKAIEKTKKSDTEVESSGNLLENIDVDKNNDVLNLAASSVLRMNVDEDINTGLLIIPDSSVFNAEYESDNDMFVPPTPPENIEIAAFASVMATSISGETREVLKKFVTFFNLKLHDGLFSDSECLISDELTYTHKWLYARCKGIPVIESQWMVDSLKRGQQLPISKYLFEPSFSIPKFFKELDIIVCPPFADLSGSDYVELWKMAGARATLIKNWTPGPVHLKRIIAVDMQGLDLDEDKLENIIKFHRAPVVTHVYLMKMLTEGIVDSIDDHLILKISSVDLEYMGFS